MMKLRTLDSLERDGIAAKLVEVKVDVVEMVDVIVEEGSTS